MADGASSLRESLRGVAFALGRFKTGTPCRVHGRSIDFARCERQDGDVPPPRFSHGDGPARAPGELFSLNHTEGGVFHVEQLPCWITHTRPETHAIIRDNL